MISSSVRSKLNRKPGHGELRSLPYLQHPRARGIVAWWLFTEGDFGSTIRDIGPYGYHMTWENGGSSVPVRIGQAGEYSGADQDSYHDFSAADPWNHTRGTVSLWARWTQSAKSCLFSSNDSSTSNRYFTLCQDLGLELDIWWRNVTDHSRVRTTASGFNDGDWHHIVFLSDDSSYSMWIDGDEQSLTVVSGSNDGRWFGDLTGLDNVSVCVFRLTFELWRMVSDIDNIIVWNRTLTDGEIVSLYTNPLLEFEYRRLWAVSPADEAVIKSITDAASGIGVIDLSADFSLPDTGSGTDAPVPGVSFSLIEAAQAQDVDAISALTPISDTGSGQAAVLGVTVSLTASDTASAADSPVISVLQSILDTALGSDVASVSTLSTITDAASGTTALSLSVSFVLGDTGLGTDAVVVDTGAIIKSILDATTASDSALADALLTVTESGVATESFLITVTLALTDAAGGTDSVLVQIGLILKTVTDLVSGADAVTLQPITANVPDVGLATTVSVISAILSTSDTTSGLDAASIQALLSIADTALSSGAEAFVFSIPIAESATISDTISQVLASLSVAETAAGADTVTAITPGIIGESTFTIGSRTITTTISQRAMTFTITGGQSSGG